MKGMMTGLALLASISAQAAPRLQARLLVRSQFTYQVDYIEDTTLERGASASVQGYDFSCTIVGEDTLALVAYRPGTLEAVKAELVAMRVGEGSLTLERGRLLYSCYLTE
jgi:hypothetical protein